MILRLLFIPALIGAFALFFLDWVVRGTRATDWPQELLDWMGDL